MDARLIANDEPQSSASSVLRTLALCNLVDPPRLVERIGDLSAADLIRKHDRLARALVNRHGGKEIDKADGFMMMFDRPVEAVAFALDYQRGLKQLNAVENANLSARVGIHVGEVERVDEPVTSRLMNLALPGQILLSNIAYDLAHRAQDELGEYLETIRWRKYGCYRFRGVPDPLPIFEVGEKGLAPLKPPPFSSDAHRDSPFWRRPASVAIAALVFAALIVVPLVMLLRPDPAVAFAKRDWVVIGSLHNLTDEAVFDDALESALRIGLEQSRFVNVLAELKVRDTITRMHSDPDKTEVDRKVGSEVALRDGATALILPTVTEIGGRVRVTAEVIDPHTQVTVYSETAEGIGKESILSSLDSINERLRVRLGEARTTVSNESKPLEKVASRNLDALKAYSLCTAENAKGRFAQAIALCQQALAIAPDFASANVRIGGFYVSMGKGGEAAKSLKSALSKRDRLTTRDVLYAEVLLASVESKTDILPRWAALDAAYPDFFDETGGYAFFAWRDANRFDKRVLDAAQSSAALQNPSRAPALHLLGIVHLGNEQFAEALKNFADAEAAGIVLTEYRSATAAAKRDFANAELTLLKSAISDTVKNPAASSIRKMFAATFLVDQGKIDSAQKLLASAARESPDARAQAQLYKIAALGLNLRKDKKSSDRLKALFAVSKKQKRTAPGGRAFIDSGIGMIAFLAARHGDAMLARSALSLLKKDSIPAYSVVYKLQIIAEAELDRTQGRAAAAIAKLEPLLDGSELFLTHAILLEAYAKQKQTNKALGEARWLANHRGRAYAESSPGVLLTAINVEQSNLALLRGAELAADRNGSSEAAIMLKAFLDAWPDAKKHPTLAGRISQLQAVFSESESP